MHESKHKEKSIKMLDRGGFETLLKKIDGENK